MNKCYNNKRAVLFLLVLLPGLLLEAQVTPQAPYTSNIKVNHVRVWDATAPMQDTNNLLARSISDVKQTTIYYDGLGRPLQTVVKKGSLVTNPLNPLSAANAIDLVSPVVYDEFGRESFKYLPFGANNIGGNTSVNDGMFKLNPFQQQAAFYIDANPNSPIKGQGETYYYGQVKFEASPLNRIDENFAPGNSWAGTSGQAIEANRRSVKSKYWINTAVDAVREWTVSNVTFGTFGNYASASTYPAGELYKNVTVDEHNKQVIEFTDKEGKLILKKVQLTAVSDDGTGKDHTGWLCTYYIYDDLSNLRCVIQPQAVKMMNDAETWDVTPYLAEQCFRYEYDKQQRMVMKKVPGATEVYLVYDARDRLVMTQDALLRAGNKWMVTLYDELNRPIQTGFLLNTYTTPAAQKTFVQHLADAANSTAYPFSVNTPPTSVYWEHLTKTGYDNYSDIPVASGLTEAIDNTYNNSTYDINTSYNVSPDYAQPLPTAASLLINGLVTWTETKVMGTNTYLYAVNLYDDKRRLVQVKSKNITGGADLLTTQYSWSGQPLVSILKQVKSGANTQTTVTVTKMIYDDLGRLVQTDKKIQNSDVNGNALPASYTTISKHEYDALGQLKKKMIGNKPGATAGTPLANLDYDYNIRGWLLSINKNYITSSNNDQYFGMQLGYDKNGSQGTFLPQYNGNIGGTIWKSEGDQQTRKYDFTYDAVNRLTKADFTQYVTGSGATATFNTSAGVDFSMGGDPTTGGTIKYDANGNITEMWQTGLKVNSSSVIDKLTYSYNTNSNRLLKVFDNVTSATDNGKLGDFKDGSNGAGDDYTYDDNGNLIADNNKAISSIAYNHLNLPMVITVTGKGTISYIYDAAGNKQQKTTAETGATVMYNGTNYTDITINTTTTYLGKAVYESKAYTNNTILNTALGYTDKLHFISHEEGRIRGVYDNSTNPNTITGLAYDYMLKDHLGNVRIVITEEQKQNVYQAGMESEDRSFEAALFGEKVNSTSVDKPAGFDGDGANAKVSVVNGTTAEGRVGPGVILKVMAGDKIRAATYAWYVSTGMDNSINSGLNAIVSSLIGQLGPGITGLAHGAVSGQVTDGILQPGMETFVSMQNQAPNAPKAYLNWVLLDEEQFKLVSGSYGVVPVPAIDAGQQKQLLEANGGNDIEMKKNGYLYVFVSNESIGNVFFDDIRVEHIRGPLTEETHYYPFGLTMAGISSKTLNSGYAENKYKYNGIEQNNELDINVYDAFYRNLDPQIGRFWQIDPKIESAEAWSAYNAMLDNPIRYADPLGDSSVPWPARVNNTYPSMNPMGPLLHHAASSVKVAELRTQYDKEVAKLGKDDKQGRADLKEKTRNQTPEVFNAAVEKGRPMEGERAKVNDPNFKGNATKSNAEVNELAKTTGVIGKTMLAVGLAQSTITVATSDNPIKEVVTETAGWGGAMYGGGQGATLGVAIGGPYGGLAGSIIGSGVGFFLGKTSVDRVLSGKTSDNIKNNREIIPDWNPRPGGGLGN